MSATRATVAAAMRRLAGLELLVQAAKRQSMR